MRCRHWPPLIHLVLVADGVGGSLVVTNNSLLIAQVGVEHTMPIQWRVGLGLLIAVSDHLLVMLYAIISHLRRIVSCGRPATLGREAEVHTVGRLHKSGALRLDESRLQCPFNFVLLDQCGLGLLLLLMPEHVAVLMAFQQSLREVVSQIKLRLQLFLNGLLSRQRHCELAAKVGLHLLPGVNLVAPA